MLHRGGNILPFVPALLQLSSDFGGGISRPSLGGVEGDDAHRTASRISISRYVPSSSSVRRQARPTQTPKASSSTRYMSWSASCGTIDGERCILYSRCNADAARRPSITKTERPRSANLLQMPRGLMCKLRQRGRNYGGPAGSRGIDPSMQPPPAQQLLGRS